MCFNQFDYIWVCYSCCICGQNPDDCSSQLPYEIATCCLICGNSHPTSVGLAIQSRFPENATVATVLTDTLYSGGDDYDKYALYYQKCLFLLHLSIVFYVSLHNRISLNKLPIVTVAIVAVVAMLDNVYTT